MEATFKIHLAQKSEGAHAPLVLMGMTPLKTDETSLGYEIKGALCCGPDLLGVFNISADHNVLDAFGLYLLLL